MVLDNKITKSILDFVKIKPRTVQEISNKIKKNWRTAERYVEKIEEETGTISSRIFREGTRGALKIVYWNFIEDIHSTSFQEELTGNILQGKNKSDFSPFDIYQFIDPKNKKISIFDISHEDWEKEVSEKTDFANFLRSAEKQILIFSGNLSWVNAKQDSTTILDVIRELVERNVSIKIISRVSIIGADNAKKILEINKEIKKDLIEIKHRRQPLRGMIVDNKIVKLREKKEPEYYQRDELKKKIEIFYDMYDKDWIEWLQKVFWKMYSSGIPAQKRLNEIEAINKMII
jgi:hypothetical protein